MTAVSPITKAARQGHIAEILARARVRSQDELAELLVQRGVRVAQATLSRDLDELGAVRLRGADGALVYALPGDPGGPGSRPGGLPGGVRGAHRGGVPERRRMPGGGQAHDRMPSGQAHGADETHERRMAGAGAAEARLRWLAGGPDADARGGSLGPGGHSMAGHGPAAPGSAAPGPAGGPGAQGQGGHVGTDTDPGRAGHGTGLWTGGISGALHRVAADLLITAEASANLVVLRTPAGGAQLLASAIDHAGWPSILGTVAGDDTVLVIARDPAGGDEVASALIRLAEGRP